MLLILFLFFITGCVTLPQYKQMNCTPTVEIVQVKTPVYNECPKCKECKDTTTTKIQESIVYRDSNPNKYYADVYYAVAIKELDGYYDEILINDTANCTRRLKKSEDYLETSIGYYQNSGQDFKLKIAGLEQFDLVLSRILHYCQENATGIYYLKEDYAKEYNKYVRYMNSINETIVVLR